ncbi:MAG: lamin tail domain-containing protein, partial [Bacteroidota bacterium]
GQNLISTQTYQITVVNLEDISNNAMPAQSADFTYFDIQAAVSGDLIITEIQADPTPSQGLPEFEYMELYNASDKVLQLSELSISTGSSPEPIPDFLLLPNQYVLLVDDSGASAFNIDNVVGLNRFPTLADREDEINITNTNEESILSLIYFDDWYPDGDFNDGGFALELIDLTKAQDCPSNWSNSIDSNGGTPGLANSLLGSDTEQDAPQLIEFEIVSASELQLIFNEQLDLSTALNFSTYDFSPALDIMDIVESEEPNGFSIILNTPIQAALAYELTIGTALSDCIGNTLAVPIIQRFGLPEAPAANDIVINELLSFPISGGSDFVELYNRSAKIINLKGIDLLNTFKISGDTLQTIEVNYLLFPQEFVVLTEVPEDITSLYEVRFPEKILDTNLPTLDNNEGNITLRFGGLIIDAFDYNDDLRFSLLDNTRGISLERISTEQPTNASGNWHSAAESVGFATPTYENSQLVSLTPVSDIVTIENPRFSPDGDGFEDVLLIQVNPGVSGYVANAKVFDSYGRLVKDLVNNRLLASEDLLKWDGRNNEETMARLGAYVLWIELFDLEGNKQIMKETIVVAGRLD